jgi:hypothetical protein
MRCVLCVCLLLIIIANLVVFCSKQMNISLLTHRITVVSSSLIQSCNLAFVCGYSRASHRVRGFSWRAINPAFDDDTKQSDANTGLGIGNETSLGKGKQVDPDLLVQYIVLRRDLFSVEF